MTLKPPAAVLAVFARVAQFLRKLPIAQYISPIWKGALKEAVQRGGDQLQAELNEILKQKAAEALPEIQAKIDGLQERFAGMVRAIPCLPASVEKEAIAEVNRAVDSLQARLEAAAVAGGIEAVQAAFNAAFDRFQEELKARIAAI